MTLAWTEVGLARPRLYAHDVGCLAHEPTMAMEQGQLIIPQAYIEAWALFLGQE